MAETVVKDFKVKNGLIVADGGTFGGTVTVATPTELFHAATKAYVDANAGGNASIQVDDVAPENPTEGNAWFDSTTGRFYIYFDSTWVEIGGGTGGGSGNFVLSETAPETASEGDTWFNTALAKLYVYYDSFWVEAVGGKTGATGPMFLEYRGEWDEGVAYDENEGVTYLGSLWRLDAATSPAGTVPSEPNWQLVVEKGDKGDTGELTIGTVTTVVNGTPATVTNSGTSTDAILDFEIPAGPRSTIEVGTVTTVPDGTPATVTNSGTESDAVFDFEIPAGPRSTIEIGTVTTGDYSSEVTVTNSGTTSDAIFNFSIPQGIPGDFVVSETAPENPLEGHVWYDSTRGRAYVYYDGFWVEYSPGFVGPQGPAGQDAVLNILGEYNNFYDYQIDDVVTYNGSLYIRTGEPNTGYAPTDPNYWTLIVEKGANGEPGKFYASDTAPTNPVTGDGWFDTTSTKFFIYYDSYWVEVGTSQQGEPGEPGVVAAVAPLTYDAETQTISIDLSNYATNQAVSDAIAALLDSAPSTLDTLNELAAALADDDSFAVTVTSALANKQDVVPNVSTTEIGYLDGVTSGIQSQIDGKSPISSPIFTGIVTAQTISLTPAGTASLADGSGNIQVGANGTTNMGIDPNDIQVRNGGAGAQLFINRLGGQTFINDGAANTYINRNGGDVFIGDSTVGLGVTAGQVWATGIYGNSLTTSYRSMYVSSTDTYDKLGYVASSIREKKNIEPLSYTADQILSVQPMQYHYNSEDNSLPKHPGMIAEDLHDAGLHGFVSYDQEGLPASINYEFYVAALQQVVREQSSKINDLIARVATLEKNAK